MLKRYKTARFLKTEIPDSAKFWGTEDLRSIIKIASIDDEPFQPLVNLRNLKYEIKCLGDIKDINEVNDYSIVLCDLMGVGVFFDSEQQGATIIKEIRSNYPSIFVIAYTGANLGTTQAKAAKKWADDLVKKDALIEEWQTILDKFIKLASDPYELWIRTRHKLVSENVDTLDILKLEDAYVRSVLKHDSGFFNLKKIVEGSSLTGVSKAVVTNLVSAAIFAAAT